MQVTDTLIDPRSILAAIQGSRLSYGSNAKGDSHVDLVVAEQLLSRMPDVHYTFVMGEIDRKFCEQRIAAGVAGEDKFLRTIPVSCTIRAPLKWWVELDTYKVGTVRQSNSLMHRTKAKGLFTDDDFDVTDTFRASPYFRTMVDNLNAVTALWLESGHRSDKWDVWTDWQDMVPRSYQYTSHWTANYAVLRLIYRVRKNHRMSSQWKPFCSWIESLPESWLITSAGKV